jgi:hypothetical protein
MKALRLGGRGLSDIHDRRRLILLCGPAPDHADDVPPSSSRARFTTPELRRRWR